MAPMITKLRELLIVSRQKGLSRKIKSKSMFPKWKPDKWKATYSDLVLRQNIFIILKLI